MTAIRRLARQIVIFALVAGVAGAFAKVGATYYYDRSRERSFAVAAGLDPSKTYRKCSIPVESAQACPADAWTTIGATSHTDYALGFFRYGAFGSLMGVALWIFYRLVRFAVKG
jgi:hypothetical protein